MKIKCPYFKSIWNLLDIIVILVSIIDVIFFKSKKKNVVIRAV